MALVALAVMFGFAAGARAAGSATKVVSYRGYAVTVPAGWPVYRLATDHSACVRFDRHAVYLGSPSAGQRCPAFSIGRTEAVLVEPLQPPAAETGSAGARLLPLPSREGAHQSSARIDDRGHRVTVVATWNRHPAVVRRALHLRSLARAAAASSHAPRPAASVIKALRARSSAITHAKARPAQAGGGVYTGLGFDACSAPSLSQMSAWGSSPYRAIGVYIGGTNMGCSQPNLSSTWVGQETAAGWHLIPIYVGLQAPADSCGCASMSSSPTTASSQGAAAAQDAVAQAQAFGIGPGSPIYNDMEGYSTTTTNVNSVMAFLAGWTAQLHAEGYLSGVYSSGDSGVVNLATRYGTGYTEPDDIWIARWNNAHNTSDPNVPSTSWANHQRLHQYDGDHNETYGGVRLDIDGDYVDGATAGTGGAVTTPSVAAAPSLSLSTGADGAINLFPSWNGATGVSRWQVIAGSSPSSLAPAARSARASTRKIVVHSAFSYFAVQALGSAGQVLATSAAIATPSHVAVFGQSAFVLARGKGGLPVGCFNTTACHVTTTVSVGAVRVVKTGRETVPVGGGLAYFKLSRSGQTMLRRARRNRLPVTVTVRDTSGKSATRALNLIQFKTFGSSPSHSQQPSAALRFIGATEFVSNGWSGGILVACTASSPCLSSLTIRSAGKTIAHTGQQFLGVNELGYLHFSLTAVGHRMLLRRHGNQLPATLSITTPGTGAPGPTAGPTTPSGGGTAVGGATTSTGAGTAVAQITLASFR
ncbi:MAG TPA: DUF1906 domain-containing protein [Solirubrobacteraceae bacterium]